MITHISLAISLIASATSGPTPTETGAASCYGPTAAVSILFVDDTAWIELLERDGYSQAEALKRIRRDRENIPQVLPHGPHYLSTSSPLEPKFLELGINFPGEDRALEVLGMAMSALPELNRINPLKFNPHTFVPALVQLASECDQRVSPVRFVRPLLRYAELWQDKVSYPERIKIWSSLASFSYMEPDVGRMIGAYWPVIEPDIRSDESLMKKYTTILGNYGALPVLASTGYAALPNPLKWRFRTIFHLEPMDILESNRIQFTKHVDRYVGCCSNMEEDFSSVVFPWFPHSYGKGARLYIDGVLVGLMKAENEKSFLALRTVRNSSGRFTLVQGGVYASNRDLWETAEVEWKKNPKQKWPRINLEYLKAFPLRPFEPENSADAYSFKDEGFEILRRKLEEEP